MVVHRAVDGTRAAFTAVVDLGAFVCKVVGVEAGGYVAEVADVRSRVDTVERREGNSVQQERCLRRAPLSMEVRVLLCKDLIASVSRELAGRQGTYLAVAVVVLAAGV